MALIIFLLLLLSILFIYYHFYYKLRKLPPGPTPLPLLGNLLQMSQFSSMELALLAWRRQYGPVFTYWLGNFPVVAIADYQKMVETVVKDGDAYTDRQTFPFERVFRGDDVHGIISSSGERWREQRRFALQVFRDFGVGKNLMQDRILDEITAMFHKLNKQMEEEPESEVNLCSSVDLAVGSIINNVMFGYRLEGEREPEFWEIKHMLDEHMKKFGNPLVVLWVCYPFVLDHVPYFKQMGQGFQQRLKYFFEFFERKIVEHPRDLALDSDAEPRDYVEAFLKEKRRRELAGEDHRYFTITQLSNNCFDLWIAGQETTSNVLAWGIACLLNHQNALEKLYAELDAVIGNTDRLVTVADRQSLPYTNAVINETLRVANIIPFNIRRTLSRDVCLDGYLLAKGTCIVPEISVVLCDDNIFAEASKFIPERFLDEQGKLQRCDELIPFSQGKRQCLGEPLARMELFLFIANIFNRYKVMSGRQMPSLKRTLGAVVRCEPFTCRMEKR